MLTLPSILSNLEHLQLGAKQSIWIQMQYLSKFYRKPFSNLTGKKPKPMMYNPSLLLFKQSMSPKDCSRGGNIFHEVWLFCCFGLLVFFTTLLYNSAIAIELETKTCGMMKKNKILLWELFATRSKWLFSCHRAEMFTSLLLTQASARGLWVPLVAMTGHGLLQLWLKHPN